MKPDTPLLKADGLTHHYGANNALESVSFELYPAEVITVVGESGSGKSTLLKILSSELDPDDGAAHYQQPDGQWIDMHRLPETRRRHLCRSEWGFVTQHGNDGLRLNVSAGANIGERPMAPGVNRYDDVRAQALEWMRRVELCGQRIGDEPGNFSGGMKQRLQIARNLVSRPRGAARRAHLRAGCICAGQAARSASGARQPHGTGCGSGNA